MKIAVTYDNGQIFQHFGHSAQFKLYEVSGGMILNTAVVDTNGSGHGALAGFLKQNGVDTLICGGIGGGAQAALTPGRHPLLRRCQRRCRCQPCWPCWQASLAMTPMCAAPTTMKRTLRAATPAAAMVAETTAATDNSQPAQLPCKKAEGFALSSLSPFVKSVKKYLSFS